MPRDRRGTCLTLHPCSLVLFSLQDRLILSNILLQDILTIAKYKHRSLSDTFQCITENAIYKQGYIPIVDLMSLSELSVYSRGFIPKPIQCEERDIRLCRQ